MVSSPSVTTSPLVNSGSNILESTEFHDGLHANVVLANMSHFRDEKFMCDIEIEVCAAISLSSTILTKFLTTVMRILLAAGQFFNFMASNCILLSIHGILFKKRKKNIERLEKLLNINAVSIYIR